MYDSDVSKDKRKRCKKVEREKKGCRAGVGYIDGRSASWFSCRKERPSVISRISDYYSALVQFC